MLLLTGVLQCTAQHSMGTYMQAFRKKWLLNFAQSTWDRLNITTINTQVCNAFPQLQLAKLDCRQRMHTESWDTFGVDYLDHAPLYIGASRFEANTCLALHNCS